MSHKNQTNSYTEFFYKAFRNILIIGIPTLIISILVLSSLHSSAANSANDNLSLSIPVSCSLSATVSPGEEHAISMVAGTYEDEIGKTIIDTTCNDPNGYVVYAIGNTGNSEGSNVLYPSTISETYSIPTGTNTSGDASQWAMKLTAINSGVYTPTIDNGYTSYSLVPSSWVKVAHKDPGTTDVTKNSAFITTYAIYLEGSQPAGTYNGQVKYVMLHPSTAPHPTDTIEHAFALAGKTKLILKTDGTVVPETSPEAEDIPEGDIVGRYYRMQDMETSFCENTSKVDEQNTTQLIDIRDNKTYWVTKFRDNHCWMTQNLDLDINGPNTSSLTSENTDISITASGDGIYDTAYGYSENSGVWTWNPVTTTRNIIVDYANNTASGWNNNTKIPYSAEGGDAYFYTSGDNNPDTRYDSLQDCENANHAVGDCKHYHVGNYYNWTAAIASNNSNGFNSQYDNAVNSICPKGWRLPIANTEDQSIYEFRELLFEQGITTTKNSNTYAKNGFNNIRKSPLWFVRAGYTWNNALRDQASVGNYLSGTAINENSIFRLSFGMSGVDPLNSDTGYWDRYYGLSIRCLAR